MELKKKNARNLHNYAETLLVSSSASWQHCRNREQHIDRESVAIRSDYF